MRLPSRKNVNLNHIFNVLIKYWCSTDGHYRQHSPRYGKIAIFGC